MGTRLFGTKLGMTRVFDGDVALPVTVIQVEPNEVVEVKTGEKHGYEALKVACGDRITKKRAGKGCSKSVRGEYKKADVAPRRHLREVPPVEGAEVGTKLTVELLSADAKVHVVGTSKGHGFAGVMKRHNFRGHGKSHGTQKHRGPGSIGCRLTPGKVFKNKKMAGHYGVDRVTVRNLAIVRVDPERNLVLVKGSVPGPNGGLVGLQQD